MKKQQITYLSIGTNQGNRLENLQNAINLIASSIGTIQKIASVYETPSLGFDGADFYNTCIKLTTHLSPENLIKHLLSLEDELGRTRKNKSGYTDRIIDLDILLYTDEIIFSENLIVPHPRMLQRKFVLVPLVEIAKNILHPTAKKNLHDCLINCSDTSEISKIKDTLKIPITISDTYNYIAIEGNIGAGKTSLSTMMAHNFNSKLVLERFADNPFLPKFYQDKERYAFPLEMSFLADRHQQLTDDLAQFNGFKNCIISDYYMFKSLIFAQVTLPKEEYTLYQKMFDLLYKEVKKPDLYVYLYQNTERLLENIKNRGRAYEQNIAATYLQKIEDGYSNFIKKVPELNILVIDVSELDFVNNPEDYRFIIDKIVQHTIN
ncbi:2-amino-4-hydroxy-6-hydroxymethyldihydropteridine diphosphokinase [Tenacibaculum finnmarkense genomovar finnmarkense]|uniref:2-amino-4-hydroxy-6-hydroxymethyldihydropteridine pyrophosphokinase n=1 Tax=Tenacibaculum finnmarkense genomovar finnmarkense TaxID=1458503 RepID=A0AAP1RGU2_9FLAO|nr:2-amino-4-hydroxy-6-hydroxymethyldihydropteridine diphosphokinase [Tenacibaculum finnmarkense]MBE7653761.1 2-amino-4-hydroxy-6-hydroxymethyldihydropteridine diphosphokinase [Tenacibaculum finnmarkense genomovar finnmarkense]MBE7660024.1 2-amino-4-hydroxy-6-hydroxymethyldihydropteridine diphosphokinase [Tenacibaculum finnmarkense genomovar finnmarkense]MBE7696050.1 2-amino-4-hydroxy-6-hydroxymethyldihydropteridine diphosphokinase [Tenacibaculum finnmarkense genomovar finnmarkense]MCD8403008.1